MSNSTASALPRCIPSQAGWYWYRDLHEPTLIQVHDGHGEHEGTLVVDTYSPDGRGREWQHIRNCPGTFYGPIPPPDLQQPAVSTAPAFDMAAAEGSNSNIADAGVVYPKVVVLCTNSEGSPEFYSCSPTCTQADIDEGRHYDLAKENAEWNGYEGPMIAFDATDEAAKQLGEVLAWI